MGILSSLHVCSSETNQTRKGQRHANEEFGALSCIRKNPEGFIELEVLDDEVYRSAFDIYTLTLQRMDTKSSFSSQSSHLIP